MKSSAILSYLMAAISTLIMTIQVEGQQQSGSNVSPKDPTDTIRVATMIYPPYIFEENPSERKPGQQPIYKGFVIDLMNTLQKRGAFNHYHLIVRTDGKFGHFVNNTWKGLIGELVNHEADVVVAPLTESALRAKAVSFGTQFQTFGRAAFVKQWLEPKSNILGFTVEIRLGRLFAPLEGSVWLLSGLAWFVSSLVLYIICRINPYEWRRMTRDREATLREGESFNCVNTYWFMLGAVFWQGFMRSPRSMGARIVVTFWWLYALIFVSMYIASLTNFLQSLPYSAPKRVDTTIKSLKDIVDNPRVQVGAIEDGNTWATLKTSENMLYYKIWERMENDNSYAQFVEEGVARVRNSTKDNPYVFIAETTMANYYISQPPCDVAMIREFPMTGSYSLAFPMDGNWQSTMNFWVNILKEDGTLTALRQKWFSGECKGDLIQPTPAVNEIQYPPFQKVDLTSFSGALILLIIGLASGSIVTAIEYFIFKYTEEDIQDHRYDNNSKPLNDKNDTNMAYGHPSNKMEPMTDV